MTDRRAFSQEEWELIRSVPLVAGLAVARATRSGLLGGVGELRTLLADIGRPSPGVADGTLVAAIVADRPQWHLSRLTGSDTADPAQILDDAVDLCTEARALVVERGTVEEAEQLRAWTLSIAHDVAAAHREDDRAESDGELAAITAIDAALRGR